MDIYFVDWSPEGLRSADYNLSNETIVVTIENVNEVGASRFVGIAN